MKYVIFFIIGLVSPLFVISQDVSNNNTIQTTLKVRALQEKKLDYNKKSNGESDGYRVKIHFSSDKTKAREVQTKFNSKYSKTPSYEEYQQPNFVIIVGDFKTKLEASEFLETIKFEYPNAFIVKSKIRPTKL